MPAQILSQNAGGFSGTSGTATWGAGTTGTGAGVLIVSCNGQTVSPPVAWVQDSPAVTGGTNRVYVFRRYTAGGANITITPAASAPVAWVLLEVDMEWALVATVNGVSVNATSAYATASATSLDTGIAAGTTYDGLCLAVHGAPGPTPTPPTWSGHTGGFTELYDQGAASASISTGLSVATKSVQSLGDYACTATSSLGGAGSLAALMMIYNGPGARQGADYKVLAGFEQQTAAGLDAGIAGTAGDGARYVDALGGSPAVVTTTPRSGGGCLELASASAVEWVRWSHGGRLAHDKWGVLRFSFRFPTALPAADVELAAMIGITAPQTTVRFRNAGDQIGVQIGAGAEQLSVATVVADTWYSLDIRLDQSTPDGSTYTADWQLDGVAQAQATLAGQVANATVDHFYIGWQTAVTATVRYDDIVVATRYGQYPIGDVTILPLKVDPAGTLTISGTSTNFQTFTLNGTMAAWNATTARGAIDDIPPVTGGSADGLAQVAAAAADYVEIPMETLQAAPGATVRAVGLVACGWAASGSVATLGLRGWDGTAETTLLAAADPLLDATSAVWVCKLYTPSGGWSQAKLDALAFRVGFSGDATPDIGIHAILAEVATQPAVVVQAFGEAGGVAAAGQMDPVTGGVLGVTVDTPAGQGTTLNWEAGGTPGSQAVAPASSHTETFGAADSSVVTFVEIVSDPVEG